jgi:hypothetical protein
MVNLEEKALREKNGIRARSASFCGGKGHTLKGVVSSRDPRYQAQKSSCLISLIQAMYLSYYTNEGQVVGPR